MAGPNTPGLRRAMRASHEKTRLCVAVANGTALALQALFLLGDRRNIGVNDGATTGFEEIRAAIARYLRRHPLACDTAQGIRAWWLAPEGLIAMESSVEAVVERMCVLGELRRIRLPDGQQLYGRAEPGP